MPDIIKQRLRFIDLVGTAAIVTVLAGTAAFGVVPMLKSGRADIRDSAELSKQLRDLDTLNVKLAVAERDRAKGEDRLRLMEGLLPDSSGMNQFVQELAKVAEDAGLQVDAVAPSPELKDAGAYKRMSVCITGHGDWDTCYKFLTGLRGPNRKLTRLDNIYLESVKEKSNECHIEILVSALIPR